VLGLEIVLGGVASLREFPVVKMLSGISPKAASSSQAIGDGENKGSKVVPIVGRPKKAGSSSRRAFGTSRFHGQPAWDAFGVKSIT
jgi:hypothetical protein